MTFLDVDLGGRWSSWYRSPTRRRPPEAEYASLREEQPCKGVRGAGAGRAAVVGGSSAPVLCF